MCAHVCVCYRYDVAQHPVNYYSFIPEEYAHKTWIAKFIAHCMVYISCAELLFPIQVSVIISMPSAGSLSRYNHASTVDEDCVCVCMHVRIVCGCVCICFQCM